MRSDAPVEVVARPHDPKNATKALPAASVERMPSRLSGLYRSASDVAATVLAMPMQYSAKALGLPMEFESSAFEEPTPTTPTTEATAGEAAAPRRGLALFRAVVNASRFVGLAKGTADVVQVQVLEPKGEVAELLNQHADGVQKMADALASDPLFKPDEHDALWRLRFLLSAKNKVDKATKDAARCLQWRKENNIDEIAAKVRSTPWHQWPGYAAIQKYTPDHVTHPDTNKGTVVFKRMAENDFDGLLGDDGKGDSSKMEDEEWIMYQFYLKEWLFQRRDAVSRKTGSMAKNMVVVDMGGLSRKHLGNKRFKALMSHPRIKTADEMYPQALGTIVMVKLPGALSFLFNTIVKPLAPAKVQEKIRIASDPAKELAKVGIPLEHVPSVLGGTMDSWPPPKDARSLPPVPVPP